MSRKPRIHYPGALYHVILRGNARQDVFFEDRDRYRFYLLLQEGVERFGHRIIAFCLMTNHIHLAIQVGEVPLSRILQNLSFRYTRWINWRKSRTGHLFQGRYKAFLVEEEAYLMELVAYLHLNPVRVGMSNGAADYHWSSHRAYLGREDLPWLDTKLVLGQFSRRLGPARRQFAEFVDARAGEGHRQEFHGKASRDSRIIGDDHFVEDILGRDAPLPHRKPDLETILSGVAKVYDVSLESLSSPGQNRRLSEARMLAAWAVRELSDFPLRELAQRVGREASAMSAAAARFEARMGDPEVQKKVAGLQAELKVSIFQA